MGGRFGSIQASSGCQTVVCPTTACRRGWGRWERGRCQGRREIVPAGRREGVRNLFLTCEPLAGWRHVAVTRRRTMEDFAHQMRWLVDEAYPDTPVVRVVMDNLNTHRPASLYETFPAPEARRIAKRLEFHYTPKHGSWLNMAEIEFSVLSRSCLKQRLPDEEALRREVHALVKERNAAQATIQWRFNTQDARTKLHRLYPSDFTVD